MRDLTNEELALISGGTGGESDEKKDRWWNEAFEWLSGALSWLGASTPGWLGTYIGGFGNVVEASSFTGDQVWDRATGYNEYVIDQQSNGDDYMTFDEWSAQQGP